MTTSLNDHGFSKESLKSWARQVRGTLFSVYKKNNTDGINFFADEEQAQNKGLISQCAGGVSILLLTNAYDIELADHELESLDKLITNIVDMVNDEGYNASPFIHPNKTKNFFGPEKGYDYTDALSWVLSFAIQVRFYQRINGAITNVNHPLNKHKSLIEDLIIETLKKIYRASIRNKEKGYGWGFANECFQPSLYYSFVISECLGDYGDYIAGESPEIFKGMKDKSDNDVTPIDKDLMSLLEKEIVDGDTLPNRISEIRFETGWWLYKTYGGSLGDKLIDPTNKKPEDHNNLYNSFFILQTLVVNSTDKADLIRKYNKHETEGKSAENISENIRQCIEHGIYLTRTKFDKAKNDINYWEDSGASSFIIEWEHHEKQELIAKKGGVTLYEPGLIPLALRCNANYCYYISESKDPKMIQLFQLLREDHQTEERMGIPLWDTNGFNLMLTERAVECLVDFNDYFSRFLIDDEEEDNIQQETFETMIVKVVRNEIEKYLKAELTDVLKKGDIFKGAIGDIFQGKIETATKLLHEFKEKENVKNNSDRLEASNLNSAMEKWLMSLLFKKLRTVNSVSQNNKDDVGKLKENLNKEISGIIKMIGEELYKTDSPILSRIVDSAINNQIELNKKGGR